MQGLLSLMPEPLRRALGNILTGRGHASAGRGALAAFAIRILSAALAFASQVLLARWLGSHEFGIFTVAWVLVTIIGTLATLGLATSVIRFLPHYKEQGDFAHFRGLLRFGHVLSLIAGLVAGGLGLVALATWGADIEDFYLLPLSLALLCLPAYAMTDFMDGAGRSQGWIGLALLPPYVVRPALLFVFIGIALFVSDRSPSAATAILAAAAATWTAAAVQYALQRRSFASMSPGSHLAYRGKEWVAVSLPLLLLDGFALLMLNLDIVILKLFLPPDQIGIYFAAARTISLIAFVHFAVTAVAMPKFASLSAAGRHTEILPFLKLAQTWTFAPSAIGALGLLILGKPILWLFGPEFMDAYPVMLILSIGLLARALAGPAQSLLVALGHQRVASVILGLTVVINAAFNVLLIPIYGLSGAAAGTAIAFVFEAASTVVMARRLAAHGHDTPRS